MTAGRSALTLDFLAEESRNLGSLLVTFWPRSPPSATASSSSTAPSTTTYTVVEVLPLSLLVAPSNGGPLSSLTLPSRVPPQSVVTLTTSSSSFSAKLATTTSSEERPRPDLEIHEPLTTSDLRSALPAAFACATCDAQLVESSSIFKYNALPSEHWAELLDAWMCHQDQTLSDDLVAKGKGIKPRQDEALVGANYVLFGRDRTLNWSTPEKSQVSSLPSSPSRSHPTLLPRTYKKACLPRRSPFLGRSGCPPMDAPLGNREC